LLQKPASGGSPMSAPSPIVMDQNVVGIPRRSPPMADMRLVPTAWMTEPAPRNSSALNAAWVSRWNSAAAGAPMARAPVMYASCDTVDHASTRLMSSWTVAAQAPSTIVTAAMTASTASATVEATNSG
jgi:hypothetical protein